MRVYLGLLLTSAVLASGAVACGSDSGDDAGSADTGLTRALATIPASAADQSVLFRDVPTVRKLLAADNKLYANLDGYAIPELTQYRGGSLKGDYGFEETDVTTSLLVGNSPTSFLVGTFKPDAVGQAMKGHGYTSSKDDAGTHLTKPDSPTVDVSETVRVERTSSDAPALPLTPPEESVAGDAAYAAMTKCLGDVYEASLYGKNAGQNKEVVLFGSGAKVDAQNKSTETVCIVTASQDAAENTAKALRDAQENGPAKNYAGIEVAVGDAPVVSMTWENSKESGRRPGDLDKSWELARVALKLF
jgi:hypothetical protein